MVGDKSKKQHTQKFHRINGFLSLQLELRWELGLRLRLTNYLYRTGCLLLGPVTLPCVLLEPRQVACSVIPETYFGDILECTCDESVTTDW